MENQTIPGTQISVNLIVPKSVAWILAVIGLIIPFLISEVMESSMFLFGSMLSVLVLIWLLFLVDVINSKISNKAFWVLSLIFIPTIAQVAYLLRKQKLLSIL